MRFIISNLFASTRVSHKRYILAVGATFRFRFCTILKLVPVTSIVASFWSKWSLMIGTSIGALCGSKNSNPGSNPGHLQSLKHKKGINKEIHNLFMHLPNFHKSQWCIKNSKKVSSFSCSIAYKGWYEITITPYQLMFTSSHSISLGSPSHIFSLCASIKVMESTRQSALDEIEKQLKELQNRHKCAGDYCTVCSTCFKPSFGYIKEKCGNKNLN